MQQRPGGKREVGKIERRDRLYEAALALFREQGYEATTVDQITRQAGVAKGTFFNYFPTKDAEADTRRMNAAIETVIRTMPEQYYWVHRRFKTRPEGEAPVY